MGNHLGQQFVIEDRTGQGGMIAANFVLKAAPDGYTVMFVAPNNAIGTSLYKHLPFDFLKDSTPVAGLMRLTRLRSAGAVETAALPLPDLVLAP